MKNPTLTRSLPGFTIPELYYMETENGDIVFIFTDIGFRAMKESLSDLREELRHLIPSEEGPWGENGVFLALQPTNKGREFRIPFAHQADNEKRRALAKNLSDFLWIFSMCVKASEEKREPHDGEKTQLFLLQTNYSGEVPHGGSLSLSVSLDAANALVWYSRKEIPGVQEKMRKHHGKKFPDHRKFLAGNMGGSVRENGLLHYVTLGSCACMGVAGGKHRINEGFHLESHNVDSSWQQFNLIIGIAATWQLIRRSLKY